MFAFALLCETERTCSFRTIQAPNGISPFPSPCHAAWIASRMKSASVMAAPPDVAKLRRLLFYIFLTPIFRGFYISSLGLVTMKFWVAALSHQGGHRCLFI